MSRTLLYVSSFFFGGSESAREREPVGVCAYDYSANRKHASIAGFRFGAGAGPLAPIGVTSTRGLQPRGFAIDLLGA